MRFKGGRVGVMKFKDHFYTRGEGGWGEGWGVRSIMACPSQIPCPCDAFSADFLHMYEYHTFHAFRNILKHVDVFERVIV